MFQFINSFLWVNNEVVIIIFTSILCILIYKICSNYLKTLNKHTKNKIALRKIIKDHVFSSSLEDIDLSKRCIINTINPHSYCVSKKDLLFQKALIGSDILLPDGSGIVLASKILLGKKINKIAGADMHQHLLEYANSNKKTVFYLGASQQTLDLISNRLGKEFPNIKFDSYSPPYKNEFSTEDSEIMISKVNQFSPDILFVGMTAPKQEKWVEMNKNEINSTVITSIGAVFDFYAGTVKRSSPFWINLGLEWLPRLIREPKRLWRRNFISTPMFLLSLSKAKLNLN